ncbi:MAG: hypothetical protein IT385_25710 [Deltaproteobacteria bacterium]|nr:hypothetical protein [Deltaproteobacteria bacterium]
MPFGAASIVVPGIPIVPAMPLGPLYLTTVGVTAEDPGAMIGFGGSPKLTGTLTTAFGPAVKVGEESYVLATGKLSASWSPTELSLDGTVSLLGRLYDPFNRQTLAAKQDVVEGNAVAKLGYSLDGLLSMSFTTTLTLREPIFGKKVASGSLSGSLAQLRNPDRVLGVAQGSVEVVFPENRFFGETTLGRISGTLRQNSLPLSSARPTMEFWLEITHACLGAFSGTCTFYVAQDPVNGLRLYFQVLGGITEYIYGAPPSDATTFQAPSIGVSPGVGARVVYDGDPPAFDLVDDADALEIFLDHPDGPALADLELADGTVLSADTALHPGADGNPGASFNPMPDGRVSYWIVRDAVPGTYRLVDVRGPLTTVRARVQPRSPTITLAEPFEVSEDEVTIAWTGTQGDGTASVDLSARPLDGGPDLPIDAATLSAGERVWSTIGVPPGPYMIVARVDDGLSPPRTVTSLRPVVVGGGAVGLPAPRLVRASPDGAGAVVVSWLPSAGAERYVVAGLRDGARLDPTTIEGVATSARLDATDLDGVVVGALRGDEASPEARVAIGRTIVTRPAVEVVAGSTWRYAPERDDGSAATLALVAGPAGVAVTGGVATWATTVDDLGGHTLRLVIDGRERAATVVVVEAPRAAPIIQRAPPATAVVGQPWTWAFAASGVTLVDGPAGAAVESVEGGQVVRWTPTSGEAIAGEGYVAITVRVTDETTGLWTEETATVHVPDRDDDGLDDAWENASGLDVDAPDDVGADPDEDGRTHAQEAADGTLGDVADSDRDGLDDGDELSTSPRAADSDGDGLLDGAEAALGADPTEVDSDGDGVDDAAEVAAGTPPGQASPDGDGDGLSDQREAMLGTDPTLADSDGDGLDDGDELQLGTRPVAHDSDGDGASDGDEVAAGTDPLRHPGDLDHDGLSDDLERALGTHVGRPDTDGDHFPDRIELEAGTDPLDAADKPDDEPREAPRPTLYAGESARPVRQPFAVTHLGDIVLVPDRDRDRAPDDYEGTWEYDARDAADGASDDDGDGIPMWREAQLGTSPRAADSDGDGVDDGQELQDGTDPNDKDSFISGGAVTGLRVTPSPARLFTNTMLGAATLQLTVLGDRPTGFPSDLTAAARGTSYTLEPAGAGSVSADGYFTAAPGFAGTATITAKNAGLEATASVAIEAFTPVKIAELALPGRPGRVRLDGDRLLVVAGRKLCPVDVAIPEAPVLGACVDVAGNVVDLALRGGLGVAVVDAPPRLLTLALGGGGLTGSPTASLTRTASLPAAPRSLALGDDRAFVATGQGLLTIDLADGQVVGTELPGGDFTHVRRDLERVVVLDAAGELRVYRMITSGLVLESTKTLVPAEQDLAYRGNELWLARGGPGVMRARIGEAPGEEDVLTDAQAYAVAPVSDFFIVGARGPRPLVFVSNRSPIDIPTLGTLDYVVFDPTGLAADREHHFLAGFENNKNLLEIGRHAIYQDTLGVAPTLRPVAPVPGATVSEGPGVVLQVDAQDDVGVDVVRLYVDDALVATLTAPPYRATWPSPGVSQDRSLTIRAEAQDYGGNVGELAPYGVTLKPVVDTTAPTIAMLEPVDGEYLGANTNLRVNVNVLDDIGIDKVLVHLDGALVATIEAPPWQADLVLPSGLAGSPVLTATAVDFGENEATASATMQVVGVDLVAAGVTRIAPDDLTYDGEEILVRDGTLVIDGPHAFEAIYVGRNGVVTHSDATGTDEDLGPHMGIHVGLDLVVGFVGVMPSGGIDVSGRGHWGECQESQGCFADFHAPPRLGASHGGIGGGSPYYFDDVPPPISDDPFAPTELGLGGGYGTNLARPGGDGGGRIRLVADEILLHGRIAANGMSGPTNGAGGAGGAIWLEVGHLEGAGEITADGGAARDGTYGSGGGGRIAVHFGESELDPARVRTRPGVGGSTPRAGAGTVVLAPEGGRPTLIVHDGGRGPGRDNPALGDAYGSTPWAEDVDLVIGGQANLTAAVPLHVPTLTLRDRGEVRQWETSDVVGPTRLELEVDTLVVGPLARVEASGRGGDAGASNSRGGSHGGSGGGDRGARQPTRGDPFAPTELGERGGIGYSIYDPGGDGGGAIRITAGATTLDGTIAADGLRATVDADGADDGAGGSGGSVWLTTGTLTGAGGITADGGAAPPLSDRSGAGGGGRVAVYVTQPTTFAVDALRARPGEARPTYVAAPGTVFVRRAGVSDRIVVDDGERSGHALAFGLGWSEAAPAIEGDIDLVVRGRSQLVAVSPWRLTRLFVEGEAIVTHQDATATLETGLDVVADAVTVGPLAAIDLTGRGWSGRCKDSCSAPMTSGSDSGGSHGGLGGGVNVMPTHGDAFAPVTLGGGGGTNGTNVNHGGDGGGRARIVADAVRIDGRVVAHGARGVDTTNDAGGGAGGSIWITADAVTGEGSIAANGADAVPDHVDNSPGGGGRVAIEYQAIEPGLAERVEALPGLDQVGRFAGPGTVWLAGPGADRTFVIDDGGRGAVRSAPIDNTPSDTPLFGGADVIVRGTSLVSIGAPLDVGTLRLEDAAVLTSFDTTGLTKAA